MNKKEALNKIEELKEFIKSCDVKPKIDFSKWVGRNYDFLAIKGEKVFASYSRGKLIYGTNDPENYGCELNYEETTLEECKKGDVVCIRVTQDCNNPFRLSDFRIITGNLNDYVYSQYLCNNFAGIELITHTCNHKNRKVIRFLRK